MAWGQSLSFPLQVIEEEREGVYLRPRQVRYQVALRPDISSLFDFKPLPYIAKPLGCQIASKIAPTWQNPIQFTLSAPKRDWPSFAFRFSFFSASLFICSFICEYFLNTLAWPCRSNCVTHSSATPPALCRV